MLDDGKPVKSWDHLMRKVLCKNLDIRNDFS